MSLENLDLNQIQFSFFPYGGEVNNEGLYSVQPVTPIYEEIESSDELRNIKDVASDLKAIDWAFLNDNTSFLTHDIHPYPAKFIPQIPGHLIARLSLPGELILDPFGGSGTTALESVRIGRRALSIDANAIGTLIGKVKTSNLDSITIADLAAIRNVVNARISNLPDEVLFCNEYSGYIPEILNIDKWFPISSRGELAFIRSRIAVMESEKAKEVALLALSKIILSVSFQDSETRYTSRPRIILQGETLRRYIKALDGIIQKKARTQHELRYGVCNFITSDIKNLSDNLCENDSVDLIVTSPPYGNANDYHLYHRFRLLWIGIDPKKLAKIEIGSHLRHQKESTGFDAYLYEMRQILDGMYRVLKPGRYAALVVGDAIYNKELYKGAESLDKIGQELGFESVCIIERPVHKTKRSFTSAGRRTNLEKILILRKPANNITIFFQPPPYKLWQYEEVLRYREINSIVGSQSKKNKGQTFVSSMDPFSLARARSLVFSHGIGLSKSYTEPTWQAILENGLPHKTTSRKDSKYVTHGLHDYKGKFYPQLAKGLINLCSLKPKAAIFDPFCGSGTTLLEGYLNGYKTFGCDMNPLAAKIAKAKLGIIEFNPDIVRESIGALARKIDQRPANISETIEQIPQHCIDEVRNWFPQLVIPKMNWLLKTIRSVSDGVIRDFFEVVFSSIIRDISQQAPDDLRIRRRKEPILDADVFSFYLKALETQYVSLEKYWSIRGYSPNHFCSHQIVEGDSRQKSTFKQLGLSQSSIDLILTSPPYATALPYIDTDRLSLLVLFGLAASNRRPLENNLVGSREIITEERNNLERIIQNAAIELPNDLLEYLRDLHSRISVADVGFRRKNMPALLLRFFRDMNIVLTNCYGVLRKGGEIMIVIGDNQISVDGNYERIATTDFVQGIANKIGFNLVERINISVTRENLVHIKNAITQNVVLRFIK